MASLDDTPVIQAIVTPITSRRDGTLDGGVFHLDGKPVEKALHVRSHLKRIHMPDPLDEQRGRQLPEDDRPHLYGGILFNHFGHFLLESLGRLWAVESSAEPPAQIVFLPLWGIPDVRDGNHYVAATLSELGISPDRVRILTSPMRFSRLSVPPQLYGFYHLRDPDPRMLKLFARAGKAIADGPNDADAGLYVSRSKIDFKQGRIAGEDRFEDYLRSQGYEIMYPELLPFPEQLRKYRRASQIIFCEGSAIHSAILYCRTTARIAVILRRYDTEGWIRRFFITLGINVYTINAVLQHEPCGLAPHMGVSVVDLLRASEALKQEGFVDRVFHEWLSLGADSIRSHYASFVARVAAEPGFRHPEGFC